MERVTWTKDFSVGVAELDKQHKRLTQMINRLAATPQLTTRSEGLSEILNDMTNYAREHFATEEALMRRHNYPYLEEHIAQHRDFRRKTVDFCTAVMLDVETIPEMMLSYLRCWLTEHTLKSDMRYKPFLHPGEGNVDQSHLLQLSTA